MDLCPPGTLPTWAHLFGIKEVDHISRPSRRRNGKPLPRWNRGDRCVGVGEVADREY